MLCEHIQTVKTHQNILIIESTHKSVSDQMLTEAHLFPKKIFQKHLHVLICIRSSFKIHEKNIVFSFLEVTENTISCEL